HIVDAVGDLTPFHQLENIFYQPALIAEFDDVLMPFREIGKEVLKSIQVQLPARRQLIEDRPEMLAQLFGALEQGVKRLLRVLQLLHVRQEAAGLDRKEETV